MIIRKEKNMRQHISGKLLASGAVVMAAVCLGGCFFGNSKGKNYQEHVDNIDEHVDELTGGEKVKLVDQQGDRYIYECKDRDVTFTVMISENTASLDGSFVHGTGSYYYVDTYYDSAVHYYWQEEFEKTAEGKGFDFVNFGDCTDSKGEESYNFSGETLFIYVDKDCTDEQIEKVNQMLREVRDICIKETEFHKKDTDFDYAIVLYWYDPETNITKRTEYVWIDADTTDKELDIRTFGEDPMADESRIQPPAAAVFSTVGDGHIFVYGTAREVQWEY